MDTKEILKTLSNLSSFQGDETLGGAADEVCRRVSPFAKCTLTHGNLIAQMGNPDANHSILIDAHLDEISMVVTKIDDKGFLKIANVGGIDRRMLLGHEVTVWGKEPLDGIICCSPPHLTSSLDYAKTPSINEVYVDIGFSGEQAKKMVSVGDKISFKSSADTLISGEIAGKSLDNRASVTALILAMDLLKDEKLDCKAVFLFSAQEETGERGACVAGFDISPDEAIVVDCSFNATPNCPPDKCGKNGEGTMIGFSPVLSKTMGEKILGIVEKNGYPFQREIMADVTGTNADVISCTKAGIPTALLSIPISYMHTSVEVVDTKDIEITARLIADYILTGGVICD